MKLNGDDDYRAFSVIYLYDLFQFKCKLLFIHIWLRVVKKFLETQPDIEECYIIAISYSKGNMRQFWGD